MVQPALTKKQQEILIFVSRFRCIDRTHIQSFLQHKDKQRINKWLKDLTAKQYVRRIYDNSIIGKNKRPAIFTLDTPGVRFIRTLGIYTETFLHSLYFEKNRSETFIQHSLLIATICCELENKKNESITYEYITPSDFSTIEHPFQFLKQTDLFVDLVFCKKEKNKKPKYFLLLLLDATLPKYRIRTRIRKYEEFCWSNEWENTVDAPYPTLLIVSETKERMIYTKRFAKQLFGEEMSKEFSLNVAIAQDVLENGITAPIWEKV